MFGFRTKESCNRIFGIYIYILYLFTHCESITFQGEVNAQSYEIGITFLDLKKKKKITNVFVNGM